MDAMGASIRIIELSKKINAINRVVQYAEGNDELWDDLIELELLKVEVKTERDVLADKLRSVTL